MRKKKPQTQRELKPDEKLLWNLVTRTVTPIRQLTTGDSKGDHLDEEIASLGLPTKKSVPMTAASLRAAQLAVHSAKQLDKSDQSPKPRPVPSPAPIASHLDRPVYRKIAKGRVSIDSRIDLHDMTQAEAISRLQSFLYQAHDLGHRHVLVITGKGGSPTSEGVLRRMLPIWLNTPAFAPIVNGYQAASRNHGGDGAFYVRLRRTR